MSLTYNGTSSVLSSDATQTIGTALSGAAWFNATTEGEGNIGIIMTNAASGVEERVRLGWDGSATRKLHVFTNYTVASGFWVMTSGFAAIGKWLWIGWTHDISSTANDPILYTLVDSTFSVLTVGSGLTETGTPNGSLGADNQTYRYGNDSAGNKTFDGLLGECALWKRILTASEMATVAFNGVNSCPDHFNYLPQDGGSVQNLGSSGTAFTATNTAVGENPPIRPAGRRG